MSTIKGQNLRVFVGGACIAAATSCQIHISAQTEDASTKDDTGNWMTNDVTGLSWDLSTDSLVCLTDPTSGSGVIPSALFDLLVSCEAATIMFDQTASTNNRTAQSSVLKMSGSAFLTDISISAPNRQNSTLSCQFQGTGELTRG